MAIETVKLEGMDNVLDMLHQLPAEVVSKRGGPVRAALRKGAKVIQVQEIANLNAATANGSTSTGLLAKNVVVTRGKPPTDGKGERFLVRIKRKGYPNRSSGKGKKLAGVTTLKSAQLLEYGSSHQPAESFIRPAFKSKAAEAITTTTTSLAAAIDRIAQRLLKGA